MNSQPGHPPLLSCSRCLGARNETKLKHMTEHNQGNMRCRAAAGTLVGIAALLLAVGIGSVRANTTLWSEGFEGYNTESGQSYGNLDKNASGANAAANGVGNPWFGPSHQPGNGWVTKTMANPDPIQETVAPHSGQFMMRGNQDGSGDWYNGPDYNIDHVNIAYRFNQGAAFTNNFAIDWWFYDMLGDTYPGDYNLGPGNFGDHAGLEFSTLAPSNNDYSNSGDLGTPGSGAVTARIAIGAYEAYGSYNESVYQAQVLHAPDGQFGQNDNYDWNGWGDGWFNTSFGRTKGWHHAAITVDGNNMAVLSIDDTAVLTHDTGAPNGFNLFTTTELQSTSDAYSQSAYYDDITLSLITGPMITNTSISNGTNLVIQGTDALVGWTYQVMMGTNVTQPKATWTPITTNLMAASGPFTIVATNAVSAASGKGFFYLQGAIIQP
jgi:hypothetical protein